MEARGRILDASQTVLVEDGYAGFSMARVAEEFGGSQSLIHHYFEGKGDLLATLVARERERTADGLGALPTDPAPRLDALVETVVGNLEGGSEEAERTAAVFVELEAAAREYDDVARELFAVETLVREDLVDTVERGVEAGAFESVEPSRVAELVLGANQRAASARLFGRESETADALRELVVEQVRR